jgi:hypothetical protein
MRQGPGQKNAAAGDKAYAPRQGFRVSFRQGYSLELLNKEEKEGEKRSNCPGRVSDRLMGYNRAFPIRPLVCTNRILGKAQQFDHF